MSFKIILLHWSNSFRFVHCAILSYTVHTVSNIVHISVIRWRKFVTKSELPTKKNDMVLFSVETGKRPCISGLNLFSFFLQMLLRYTGTFRLIHPARTNRRPLLHIPLHQSFNFLFGELFDLNFHLYALLSILTA